MNRHVTTAVLLTASLFFGIATPDPAAAASQEDTLNLGPIVVTPTRSERPLQGTPGTTTVITRAEIEKKQYRDLSEALHEVPGLRSVSLGAAGSQSSVFLRGMNSNHVLVLQDGVKIVADPSTPNGAFNFAHIPLDNVERIEVLRGPLAALYGSQAMGGVINIITRKGAGKPSASILAEYGSNDSFRGQATASGSVGDLGFSVTAGVFDTDGDDITPSRYRPAGDDSEDDGYTRFNASARLDVALSEQLDFAVFGEIVDTEKALDTSANDPDSREETTTINSYASLVGHFFDGRYRPSFTVSYSRSERDDFDDPDSLDGIFPTRVRTERVGEVYSAALQNDLDIDDRNTLTLGFEYFHETLDSSGYSDFGGGFVITNMTDVNQDRGSIYLQDTFTYEGLTVVGGARWDIVEAYPDQVTWNVSPSYSFAETATTIRGSIGTGFKIPSLFERFGFQPNSFGNFFMGNPDLDPERSFGFEAGFEQRLFEDRVTFGATYFESDVKDSIQTVFDAAFNSTTVNNVDLDIHGVETFVTVNPLDWASLTASYTFTDAEDESTGEQALRRPRHKIAADVSFDVTERGQLSFGVVHLSGIRDVGFNGGMVDLDDYTVVRAAASYEVYEGVEIFSRVENLFDERYETADGFQGPGLEAFLGVRFGM
ncbi:MAG: TonB-dependent receptor [Rhodovibrionaceae bacterium]